MKKAITIIFIVFLTLLTPINGLSSVYGAGSDEWQNSDLSMQAKAFLYYCKSNNVVLEGSALDALTSFTTDTYYKICNQIGINPTELESEIKNFTSDNLGLRFLFSNTGITAMNRIFSQFLQNNDLSVSEQDVDKVIYNGKTFIDADGRKALVYVIKSGSQNTYLPYSDVIVSEGSPYRFSDSDFRSLWSTSPGDTEHITLGSNFCYFRFPDQSTSTNSIRYAYVFTSTGNSYQFMRFKYPSTYYETSNMCVFRYESSSDLYLGIFNHCILSGDASYGKYRMFNLFKINQPGSTTEDTDVTVKSPFIQNNDYTTNNNQTVNYITINNEGDVNYYYDDDEPGTTPPKPQDPSDDPSWTPVDPVIPPNNPDQGDNTIIDIPDIDIPDLPSLDFSLGDLREKFPFSIPFDIIALLSVLDGEPQAPVIDAHLPLGNWYDWHFEADFSRFDDMAALIRSVEFIGFCIGLIYITVLLVKG